MNSTSTCLISTKVLKIYEKKISHLFKFNTYDFKKEKSSARYIF